MKKITAWTLLFALLFANLHITVEAAVDPTFYYLDGEKYFVIKRNVVYKEKTLNLDTPALVIDGYNYIPAESLIANISALTGSCTSSKVTLNYNGKSLVMTVGSSSATLNGSKVTLKNIPMAIKFSTNGSNVTYIPAKECADQLGLGYEYSNTGKKIVLSESASSQDSSFKATITLSRPTSVKQGTITCTDDYHNKRLVITMSGNQTSYYNNQKPAMPSGVTFSTSYDSASGTTSLIFTTTAINGWKVKEDSSKIYIMNGIPTEMFKNVIVVDPGHGGTDPGATYGSIYKEADFNLDIVLSALKCFEGNSDYKVYSTRLSNTLPDGISKVWDRRAFANNLKADLFVSVHINSYAETSTGTETLYNSSNNVSNVGGLSCLELANIVQKHVQAATGFKDRGVKVNTSLGVLNKNNNPAVLTEIGFISNYSEAKTMAANLDQYGEAVYEAIIEASTKYPSGR